MPRLIAKGSNAAPAIVPVTRKIRSVVRPCSTIRCCMEGVINRPSVVTISNSATASSPRASELNSPNDSWNTPWNWNPSRIWPPRTSRRVSLSAVLSFFCRLPDDCCMSGTNVRWPPQFRHTRCPEGRSFALLALRGRSGSRGQCIDLAADRHAEAFETIGQWRPPIELGKFLWMDELVAEPGKLLRLETIDQPIDEVADPGNTAGIGVI